MKEEVIFLNFAKQDIRTEMADFESDDIILD
jgi:hypothetical protein